METTPQDDAADQTPVSSGREKWEERRRAKEDERRSRARNKMLKRIGLWGGAALVLVLAIWGVVILAGSAALPDATNILTDQVSASDWVTGNPSSSVVLVEYADFQCPACAAYHPVVKELKKDLGDKVAFVYRYFPLTQHKNGKPSAYAAEAAGRQGKFWEMHDLLFEGQKVWENMGDPFPIFADYANRLGLDKDTFANDYKADDVHTRVDRDYASGVNARINQTPTFFLNGKQLQNPKTFDEFKSAIQNAIPQ